MPLRRTCHQPQTEPGVPNHRLVPPSVSRRRPRLFLTGMLLPLLCGTLTGERHEVDAKVEQGNKVASAASPSQQPIGPQASSAAHHWGIESGPAAAARFELIQLTTPAARPTREAKAPARPLPTVLEPCDWLRLRRVNQSPIGTLCPDRGPSESDTEPLGNPPLPWKWDRQAPRLEGSLDLARVRQV